MRYRKLDNNGDMQFGNSSADFYVDQPEGITQAIMTRLKLWAGEWFLDISEGTPYQQAILGTGTKSTIEPVIRARILDTEGVDSIETFSLEINELNRNATIIATVNTIYGQTAIQGVI